jgi:hypothetical protein
MRLSDWLFGAFLLVVVFSVGMLFLTLSREMQYRWTTPPDQYCNVWEH